MNKAFITVLFLSVLIPDFSSVKAAAITSLSGGSSLTGEYTNLRRSGVDVKDDWRGWANVFLDLRHSRQAAKGALSLQYAANYNYDIKNNASAWSDHRFNLNGRRSLSDRLQFNLSNIFIMTNDLWGGFLSSPATGIPDAQLDEDEEDTTGDDTAQADPTLSQTIGREKFWSNYFSTSFDYEYARNSIATIGYNNRILEYNDSVFNNYKYHNPWINASFWFNPQWNTSLSYRYTDAQFDITRDFIFHDAGFQLNYVQSVQDRVFGGLKYVEKKYEAQSTGIPTVRNDYYAIRVNLGWTHAFSSKKSLSMAAGPEYLNFENQDPYTTAYFNINYTSQFKNGSWYIQAKGGFDDRNFEGENQGVSEHQRAGTGVSWQMAKDVSASLGAYIRTDAFLENPLNSDEKQYVGTADLSYRFLRWFYVSGRYRYTQVEAELNVSSYKEHRFFITLGASKELFHWIH